MYSVIHIVGYLPEGRLMAMSARELSERRTPKPERLLGGAL